MAVRAISIESFVDRIPFRSIEFHIVPIKMKKMTMPLNNILATKNNMPIPNGGYRSIKKNNGTISRIANTWKKISLHILVSKVLCLSNSDLTYKIGVSIRA